MITLDNFSPNIQLPQYPNRSGVYVIVGEDSKPLYVGSSKQLCRRVSHLTALQNDASNNAKFSHIKAGLLREYQEQGRKASIRFFECDNYQDVERQLINTHNPPWNNK
jgi:excinuclease UvrABC nuclease subunit